MPSVPAEKAPDQGKQWGGEDLNLRPADYESAALTSYGDTLNCPRVSLSDVPRFSEQGNGKDRSTQATGPRSRVTGMSLLMRVADVSQNSKSGAFPQVEAGGPGGF